jgi:hypothetical protein
VVTDTNDVFAFGNNMHNKLGISNYNKDLSQNYAIPQQLVQGFIKTD